MSHRERSIFVGFTDNDAKPTAKAQCSVPKLCDCVGENQQLTEIDASRFGPPPPGHPHCGRRPSLISGGKGGSPPLWKFPGPRPAPHDHFASTTTSPPFSCQYFLLVFFLTGSYSPELSANCTVRNASWEVAGITVAVHNHAEVFGRW